MNIIIHFRRIYLITFIIRFDKRDLLKCIPVYDNGFSSFGVLNIFGEKGIYVLETVLNEILGIIKI